MKKTLSYINNICTEKRALKTSELVFSSVCRQYCEENKCGNYGANWQCPPATGSYEFVKKRCGEFPNALLFSKKYAIQDISCREETLETLKEFQRETYVINDILQGEETSALLLGAGACMLCEKCAYPSPCRHDGKALSSMEAYGIDVISTCLNLGMTYSGGNNEIIYFACVLYGKEKAGMPA